MQPDVTASPATAHVIAPLLLTVDETAQAMRWSRTRTNAAIASGAIKSYRDGKRRFIVTASLHDYITRNCGSTDDGETCHSSK